ncbi:hypothetical protein L1887_32625 [Cichorium endivia]|nr:hypothetical protein L1887_32625 [Cichorium endivia]
MFKPSLATCIAIAGHVLERDEEEDTTRWSHWQPRTRRGSCNCRRRFSIAGSRHKSMAARVRIVGAVGNVGKTKDVKRAKKKRPGMVKVARTVAYSELKNGAGDSNLLGSRK